MLYEPYREAFYKRLLMEMMGDEPVATGVTGLDAILNGGLPPDGTYLVQGVGGTGKTTLGLQFLLEGTRQGEPVLFFTLSQSRERLQRIARSHGWLLEGVEVEELSPADVAVQTVFPSSELEDVTTTANDVAPGLREEADKPSETTPC